MHNECKISHYYVVEVPYLNEVINCLQGNILREANIEIMMILQRDTTSAVNLSIFLNK